MTSVYRFLAAWSKEAAAASRVRSTREPPANNLRRGNMKNARPMSSRGKFDKDNETAVLDFLARESTPKQPCLIF